MQTTERHGVDRFFRNPETGKVAVVQLPNLPLVLFLLLRSIELVLSPEGWVADVLHWGGTAALTCGRSTRWPGAPARSAASSAPSFSRTSS
jgi:hypothetical protein